MISPRRAAYIAAWLSLALSTAVALASTVVGFRLLDEGYILYNSWLLSIGEVPYRDLFLLYPPAMFGMLAGLFRLFGPSAMIGRATVLVAAGVAAVCSGLVARRLVGGLAAVFTAAMVVAWGVPVYNTPFPNWYCLALLMAACMVLLRPVGVREAVAVGLLVGLAGLFKQSIGVLGFGSFALVVGWQPRGRLRHLGAFAAAAAAPVAVAVALAAASGVLDAAVRDVLMFPLNHRSEIVGTTLPRLSAAGSVLLLAYAVALLGGLVPESLRRAVRRRVSVPLAMAVGVVGIAGLWLVHPPQGSPRELVVGGAWSLAFYGLLPLAVAVLIKWRQAGDADERRIVLAVSAVALVMFGERGGAVDWSHLFYVITPALVLSAWVLSDALRPAASGVSRPAVAAVAAAFTLGAMLTAAPGLVGTARGEFGGLPGTFRGIYAPRPEVEQAGALERKLRTAPAGAVYVYPVDAGLYFMAGREGAGRHAQFVHRFTEAELAEEARLVAADHPSVVVVRRPPPDDEVGYALWYSYGSPVLDTAIAGLSPVSSIGDFTVFERGR